MLSCTDAFAVVNIEEFGAGMGPIFLDEVECTGSELNLTECNHRGVNVHDCNLDHSKDAAVICSGESTFRAGCYWLYESVATVCGSLHCFTIQ